MPELAEVETPKTVGFVDRGQNHGKRKERMEAEEEEIRKLEAQQSEEEGNEEQQPKEKSAEKEEADTEAKEEALSTEEKSAKKRYGDLRRHILYKERERDKKFKTIENNVKNE